MATKTPVPAFTDPPPVQLDAEGAVAPLDYRLDPFRPIPPHWARDRTLNILQRLNLAQTEVDYVQKEKKAGMKYSIVSHDAVTAAVRPILQAVGVLYYPLAMQCIQFGNRTQIGEGIVRFENIDDRSDFIDVATAGYGIDEQDKGPGKAISYCVKYALLKALGLESGDDPDNDQHTAVRDPLEFIIDAFLKLIATLPTQDDVKAAWDKLKPKLDDAPQSMNARCQLAAASYAQRYRALKPDPALALIGPNDDEQVRTEAGKSAHRKGPNDV